MRARRGTRGRGWGRTLVSDTGILQRARMELAYFSGYARLKQRQTGGAGVILRFSGCARGSPSDFSRIGPAKSRRNFSTARSGR